MRINEFFKQKRQEKGITDQEFSKITGQNIYWVEDFDGDEEELNGLTISELQGICRALGIAPLEIYNAVLSNLTHLSLAQIVKIRREEKFWTVEDLAERIGYEPYIVEAMENGDKLDQVCIDSFKKVAAELDLPIDFLAAKL